MRMRKQNENYKEKRGKEAGETAKDNRK